MPGFLGFELLRPTAGETRYYVYTRWRSEEHYQAWVRSPAFTRGHAQAAADPLLNCGKAPFGGGFGKREQRPVQGADRENAQQQIAP